MTLNELGQNESAIILKVRGRGAFRKRIMEMGFVAGKKITVIRKAPLRDPIEYRIMDYEVSLRNSEAVMIEISTNLDEVLNNTACNNCSSIVSDCKIRTLNNSKEINVVFVGNPNSGKTTLYNQITGSHERVGNYSGVTIDAKEFKIKMNGYTINIIDLPGTYSISAYTPEELFVRDYIINKYPDVVVNIVDSSNLERNLYLTTQLIDLDVKMVIALNMYDELEAKGDHLDYDGLGKLIGNPMVPTIASKNQGVGTLFAKIISVFEDKDEALRHIHIFYGEEIEKSIKSIQSLIKTPDNIDLTDKISSRFIAIKLLEEDKAIKQSIEKQINNKNLTNKVKKEIDRIYKLYGESTETIITDARYGFISGALKETMKKGPDNKRKTNEIIDSILTHKLFGFPIFIFFMWLMFTLTFSLGSYPVAWIESGVSWVSNILDAQMNESIIKDLLINGIISGVGGVIVFLPNILLLFFFISLMEDTGYMARSVFIMDKLMHKIGLHGKSFIPLLMGFGCNVPAIMATRTLESKNDRILTMLINPFMSCSARLPIYVLFISAFFPHHAGLMLFIIYLSGIFVAIIVSLALKKFIFKKNEIPFVMELPPYRIPTIRSTSIHMWSKGMQYLKKIGGVILIAAIVIWALGYFPLNKSIDQKFNQDLSTLSAKLKTDEQTYLNDTLKIKKIKTQYLIDKTEITANYKADKQKNSYIGQIGTLIEPVIKPLGFDWRLGICILAGVPAKEIVVGTLGVLIQNNDQDENSIIQKIREFKKLNLESNKQEPLVTPLIALSFMLFALLYSPCIGTIAAISKESGSWKWGFAAVVYTTLIAWITSFAVYQIGSLLGF